MSLKIAVLTTGDELLNGELADTNTTRIAQILGAHGYFLRESLTVGDVDTDIEGALLYLAGKMDALIVTGGLGPTADDLTARAAARAFGRRLTLNDEALKQIRDYFHRLGQKMHPRNEKQALLPQRATILENSQGTAPGFLLHHQGKLFFFLPGVPDEMVAMMESSVLPCLRERSGGTFPMQERVLKVFNLSEPQIEEYLAARTLPDGVSLAFGVEFPLVHVKLRALGEKAESLLDRAELLARKALGDFVIAVGKETFSKNVAHMLIDAGLTLSLAESCTGGLIAKLLTDIPGSSAFLERGAVSYANTAKQDWLGVSAKILEEQGAVSETCALAMARGIRQAAGTDLALAVTGIAGPDGGTEQKPAGTVYIAFTAAGEEKVQKHHFGGNREKVRLQAAYMALELLRRHLCARQAKKKTSE